MITGLSWYGLMQVVCCFLLIFTVLPMISPNIWFVDLFSHFRIQYLVLSLMLSIVFVWLKKKYFLMISVCLLISNAVVVAPLFLASKQEPGGLNHHGIKLLHANVLTSNKQYSKLLKQIKSTEPDVVVLQEVDDVWVSKLSEVRSNYPYFVEVPRADNFGMAVYSQIPITAKKIHLWSFFELPNIEIELDLAGTSFRLFATHPPPPVNQAYFKARTIHFKAIAAAMKNNSEPTIVVGDFNTTVWSGQYDLLEAGTGLTAASQGFGWLPTWPTHLYPLWLPIDHCLVTSHFKVVEVETTDSIGSDHYPLYVELQL